MSRQRVLFVVKRNGGYAGYGHRTSGLKNSARFVSEMLETLGFESKLVSVVDNNDIDREVYRYRPTVVIIEALWVVPEKFDVLAKLHPRVTWIVRGHSDIPFLANEGIAINWVKRYVEHPHVYVGWNDTRTIASLRTVVGDCHAHRLVYLPNYYPLRSLSSRRHDHRLHIGCFGAIRPMKNQLLQAVAAIQYAEERGKELAFHVNVSRCEQGGESVLKNLRALFHHSSHQLVEHAWLTHQEFVHLLQHMDISMAVSLSETFCIVAADSVNAGVPLVCSAEVPWAAKVSVAPGTDVRAIVEKLKDAGSTCGAIWNRFQNRLALARFSRESKRVWKRLLTV